MSRTNPYEALRSIAEAAHGATIKRHDGWSEVWLPDGCRILDQNGALLIWRTTAVDLYCTVGKPDGLATALVSRVGGIDTYAPTEEADRVRQLWTDPRISALLRRLIGSGDQLRITNSDMTLITKARNVTTELDRCAALSVLATLLESTIPLAEPAPVVPPEFADLRGLAQRWAVGDDGQRASLIETAEDPDLRELIDIVERRRGDITRSLSTEDSDLTWLVEAADDARSQLAARGRLD